MKCQVARGSVELETGGNLSDLEGRVYLNRGFSGGADSYLCYLEGEPASDFDDGMEDDIAESYVLSLAVDEAQFDAVHSMVLAKKFPVVSVSFDILPVDGSGAPAVLNGVWANGRFPNALLASFDFVFAELRSNSASM